LTFSGGAAPAGAPTLVQVMQAVQNIRPHFAQAHNAATAGALASRDYSKLRTVVTDRASFFDLNLRLGGPLSSDLSDFVPNTQALLDTFADVLEALPGRSRARFCAEDFSAVDRIASTTTDGGANSASLDRALALVSSCADLLTASAGADRQCDDLAQALLEAGSVIAPRDPAQEAAAFPDISGRYESVEDGTEFYVTLQINQGGRYFKGRMQAHTARQDRTISQYQSRVLEGWFLRQTSQPGTMEFACRSTDPAQNGSAPMILRGTARRESAGSTTLTINGQPFVQVSDRPVFAAAVINAFEQEQRDSVRAANESPMHHRILSRVAERARSLRLIIERYYSDAALESHERDEAENLNNALLEIRSMVNASQRPLARMTIRQVLSSSTASVLKSKVARIQLIGGRIDRSHWELALGMALEYPAQINQASEMLGVAPASIRSVDQFRYRITVQQTSFPLKAIFGASELDVRIEKFRPDGSQEATFRYDGFITTAGLSAGAGVTISDVTVEVFSPFNYAATDFNGELHYTQLAAGFAFAQIGVSGGVGLLEINGSGRFPAMVLNISEVSSQVGLAAQIGWDVGVGLMIDEGTAPAPGLSLVFDDVVRFEATAEGRFDQAVFFGVDSDVISPCGLQFLREFVAEYRSLFEAPKSFIEIRGFTDRTASAAYNLDLSQRRANHVKDALLAFVGADLRIVSENISAIGLGETPAEEAGVPDAPAPGADNAAWRRVDVVVGGRILATIPTPPGRPQ
jgi:outer membrane protein OmpA-like peptidoglycan-associated protein